MKYFPVGPYNDEPSAFYCIPCSKSESCSHQGLDDVNEPCSKVTHKKNEQAIKTTCSILSYNHGGGDDGLKKKKTLRAEILHADFLVQHNIPFLTADHFAPLYSKMYPDCKIVKNVRCIRTNTTAILNEAMKPAIKSEYLNFMLEQSFALVNDGSSDIVTCVI